MMNERNEWMIFGEELAGYLKALREENERLRVELEECRAQCHNKGVMLQITTKRADEMWAKLIQLYKQGPVVIVTRNDNGHVIAGYMAGAPAVQPGDMLYLAPGAKE